MQSTKNARSRCLRDSARRTQSMLVDTAQSIIDGTLSP